MPDRPPGQRGATRALPWLALAIAFASAALFGVRVIASEDLGYHLAYGRQFLRTGRFVDHDPTIYTLPLAGPPPGQPAAERPEPGPGCWYDARGRYRFANANWLTQVILAATWEAGGVAGLHVELLLLVAALFALLAGTMRRLGAGPVAIAAALLLLAVVASPRLTLRPELFGYVALAAQAFLLAAVRRHRLPGACTLVGLVLLQALLVNLHGYFLLGLALTGAWLAGAMAGDRFTAADRWPVARRLGAVLLGQAAACFVNPWGWRLAVLPVETVAFLRRHDVAAGPGPHPWSSMGDLHRPDLFAPGWSSDPAALAVLSALAVIGIGAVASVRQRRWGALIVMGGMTLVSFSAHRNQAVGLLFALPFALAPLALAARSALRARHGSSAGAWPRRLGALPAAAAALASAALAWSAASGTLYRWSDSPARFGFGLSRLDLPLGAAAWLDAREIGGRVWTSPVCSSTISGFVEPRPDLNMITNTWAYPPEVFARVLEAGSSFGPRPFGPAARRLGVSIVVAEPGPMLRQIVAESGWVPVHLEGRYVVLVRGDGPDALLAAAPLTPETVRGGDWIGTARALDPRPGLALWQSARLLRDLGWHDEALDALAASRRDEPDEPWAWIETANTLLARARGQDRGRSDGGLDPETIRGDLVAAIDAMAHAAGLSGLPEHRESVEILREELAAFERAVLVRAAKVP